MEPQYVQQLDSSWFLPASLPHLQNLRASVGGKQQKNTEKFQAEKNGQK